MPTEDLPDTRKAALAHLVKQRRKSVSATQRQIAEAAGVGLSTYQKVEYGQPPTEYKQVSLIEDALGWTRGSFAAVLAGGDPRERLTQQQLFEVYDTPPASVLDTAVSVPPAIVPLAAVGAVGEGLTAVQQGAVRDYIEAQRAALAAQIAALERLAEAFHGDDA